MNFFKDNKEKRALKRINHKNELIKIYKYQLNHKGETRFMKIVLESALLKLVHNVDPKKVEVWVVQLESLYRKKFK